MKKCLEKEEIREHIVVFTLGETLMCLNVDGGKPRKRERQRMIIRG